MKVYTVVMQDAEGSAYVEVASSEAVLADKLRRVVADRIGGSATQGESDALLATLNTLDDLDTWFAEYDPRGDGGAWELHFSEHEV